MVFYVQTFYLSKASKTLTWLALPFLSIRAIEKKIEGQLLPAKFPLHFAKGVGTILCFFTWLAFSTIKRNKNENQQSILTKINFHKAVNARVISRTVCRRCVERSYAGASQPFIFIFISMCFLDFAFFVNKRNRKEH